MARDTAVGVDDDLAAGQPAVPHRAADDEAAGRVDVEARVVGEPLGGDGGTDDLVHDGLVDGFLIDLRVVLGGKHHRVHATRLAGFVTKRHLALGIRAQPRDRAAATHLGLTLHQAVREGYRRRHEHVGLVGRVSIHHSLIARPLLVARALVDPLGNVR